MINFLRDLARLPHTWIFSPLYVGLMFFCGFCQLYFSWLDTELYIISNLANKSQVLFPVQTSDKRLWGERRKSTKHLSRHVKLPRIF